MTLYIKLITLCSLLLSSFIYSQSWIWAKRSGLAGYPISGRSICVDTTNNFCYIMGTYQFNASLGSTTLQDASGATIMFIAKYGQAGNFVWAKDTLKINATRSSIIKSDIYGNCYVLTDLISGGTAPLKSALIKYSSNGQYEWGSYLPIPNPKALDLDIDRLGYLYPVVASDEGLTTDTGRYAAMPIYDNTGALIGQGAALIGNTSISDGTTNYDGNCYLTGKIGTENYIWKYTYGWSELWEIKLFGLKNLRFIRTDNMLNFVISGNFSSNVMFNDIILQAKGEDDVYVVKYDTSRNILWAKSITARGLTLQNIFMDSYGNVFVSASYYDSVDFGTSKIYEPVSGYNQSSFLAKYTSAGYLIWVLNFPKNCVVSSIAFDNGSNIYATGTYRLLPVPFGKDTLLPLGTSENFFVAKLYDSTMNPANNAPVIDSVRPATNPLLAEGDSLQFHVFARDIDAGDTLFYSWKLNGASVSTNNTYWRKTNYNSARMDTLILSVTDRKDTVSHQWIMTIINVSIPPVILAPANAAEINGNSLMAWEASVDPGLGDTVYYRIEISLNRAFTQIKCVQDSIKRTTIKPDSLKQKDSLPIDQILYWRLKAFDNHGIETAFSDGSNYFIFKGLSASLEMALSKIPSSAFVKQNTPNPFNPSTVIEYGVPTASQFVTLEIYDMQGQVVSTLLKGNVSAGYHRVGWDGSQMPSGIYSYRITIGNKFNKTRRMILVK